MSERRGAGAAGIERRDLAVWLALSVVGLVITYLAVRGGAKLGTASAPFLGRYRFQLTPTTLLSITVAALVIMAVARGVTDRLGWRWLVAASYLAGLGWAYSLALTNGLAGLTRGLDTTDASAGVGRPPGTTTLLGWLRDLDIPNPAIGVLLTALGVLTVPLALIALRGSCGEAAARAYAPVVVLAPYAIWLAVSLDGTAALFGAAGVMLGERASQSGRGRSGWRDFWIAVAAGVSLGVGALFSYSVAWLGLSVVCLYFARRRPLLHLGSGIGALIPLLLAIPTGFSWFDGLITARHDFIVRVEPHRSALWWAGISLVVLLLAAGPALVASIRKARNTPGWPFLVGAAAAVAFSLLAGFARGGVEHAWLPFFPWLLVAASAPERPGGEPARPPMLLASAGALAAIVTETVLATPW